MRHHDPRPTNLTAWLLLAAVTFVPGRAANAGETYRRVQLVPRDEAAADPSFAAFRAKLDAAIAAKDADFLRSILAPDVLLTFGGESGPNAFFERWRPAADDSELWSLLTELLRLGSTLSTDADAADATYPFYFESFPDDFDGFTSGVITGSNVNVREHPDAASAVIARLSHDVVVVPDWGEAAADRPASPWVRVALHDGSAGYVSRKLIRSPAGYRLGFHRAGDRWMLTFLIAGD
ncbi:MAG: SH3 domain-containing protein [bacterium]